MEVVIKEKSYIRFLDMEIGDCFRDLGEIYMKTGYDCAVYYDPSDKSWISSKFSDDYKNKIFEILNAKLVIE